MNRRERVRNAAKARRSFVTRRAELKLSALTNCFRDALEDRWQSTETGTLRRKLNLSGFHYLKSFQLIYNWENRFMAVNYNLQFLCEVPVTERFQETGESRLSLKCRQKGLKGQREYTWDALAWEGGDESLAACRQRACPPAHHGAPGRPGHHGAGAPPRGGPGQLDHLLREPHRLCHLGPSAPGLQHDHPQEVGVHPICGAL